jgi:lipoprotein-anchoring transpeptidase ErfK/SrfK
MTPPLRRVRAGLALAVAALLLVGCATASAPRISGGPDATARSSRTAPEMQREPTAAALAALPEARYDAVIPGLSAVPLGTTIHPTVVQLRRDAALYDAPDGKPIARLDRVNFLGHSTVAVPVERHGPWTRILTPARQQLPSAAPNSPAQTSAWIPTAALRMAATLSSEIEISVGRQTLTIISADDRHSFPVGVGSAETPTPVGVTGYLQARYLDPAQDEATYPIQLTSLHSTVSDEPYGGSDGGLIGLHFSSHPRGAISHGCVRMSADAITAVNALPLGTLIRLVS